MLHFYNALEAYSQRFSVEVRADQVLEVLVGDPAASKLALPIAGRGGGRACRPGPRPGCRKSSDATRRLAGRLTSLVHYSWPDREDGEEFLREVSGHCRELHDLVVATYFEYGLEDSPAG